MRKFIIPEKHLAIILQSASDATMDEGRGFTQLELSLCLDYISKMPGVLTINTSEEQVNGN